MWVGDVLLTTPLIIKNLLMSTRAVISITKLRNTRVESESRKRDRLPIWPVSAIFSAKTYVLFISIFLSRHYVIKNQVASFEKCKKVRYVGREIATFRLNRRRKSTKIEAADNSIAIFSVKLFGIPHGKSGEITKTHLVIYHEHFCSFLWHNRFFSLKFVSISFIK